MSDVAEETQTTEETAVPPLRFIWDPERIRSVKARGRIALQAMMRGKSPSLDGSLALVAAYMADEDGGYLPYDEAIEVLLDLDDYQLERVFTQFMEVVKEAALPKAKRKG